MARSFNAKNWRKWSLAAFLFCFVSAIFFSPGTNYADAPQVQQPDNGGVAWGDAGIGAATALANVVYVPVKIVYAFLGGLAGGFAFVLTGGNTQVSDTIWRASLGGDYVLTPGMIRGKDPIHFSGPTTVPQPTNVAGTNSTGAGAGITATGTTENLGQTSSGSSVAGSSAAESPVGAPAISTSPRPLDRGAGPLTAPRPAPTPDTSIE